MSKRNRSTSSVQDQKGRPNFLFIIVDEERFPTVYENEELKEWRRNNLKTQELLRENGMTFLKHYIGSTACSPSRATLFTGQYPSLHGVTQTTGVAKGAFDPNVFWLDHNTVPTLGDYFRTAGYRTFWKGKWHLSDEDILIPGTHHPLTSYNPTNGIPDPEKEHAYLQANRLDSYGFSGWIGPEPHGADPRNSGSTASVGLSGRDEVYSAEVVDLINSLEQEASTNNHQPWLIVSSFVNPHDITLFGLYSHMLPSYHFTIDPSIPFIPPAPTANETLLTKPSAQWSYRDVYQQALQPTFNTLFYRQLYFSLQKKVDDEMSKVFNALKTSTFYENTIVIFTSDHGSLVGSHGGLFQKWHNTYEEALHVPLIIHSPKHFSQREETDLLSSHVDIIPTLLGLADIDITHIQEKLSKDHMEVHPLAGRDLTPLLKGKLKFPRADEPLYFMTDDDVTRGLNQVSLTGQSYDSVVQPNHIESVIAKLRTGGNKKEEIWKFSRYFDNPQFWSNPGVENHITTTIYTAPVTENTQSEICFTSTKTQPVPDQFELYNLTKDPLEEINLAHPLHETPESKTIQQILIRSLKEQCLQKRRFPTSGNVPGMPSCDS
ncbi:sulfatase-like hydrolase/transferase [Peribacillus loiseleuriae]|uniref:Arylsulfatase n=1 Tax=Peribacillus loiseleuriae TaxID=1679170 RepID=A0A0K9GQ41_9BACI|nr:sulfatase-like hydrolase/transferase [Peribacillus loiseleuriae]KMY48706.1 arylsulfatase [Peribacillus loiseleuriae]